MRRSAKNRLLGAVLLLGACAAPGGPPPVGASGSGGPVHDIDLPWWRPPPSAEVTEALDRARELASLGQHGAVLDLLAPLAEREDAPLEVHRRLQDAAAGTTADWWLRDRYVHRSLEDAGDADAWYLLARIEPDRERQEELFDAALELDPGHPYARLGRAISLERRGAVDDALVEAWTAARSAPSLHLPWLFLGLATLARGDTDAAWRFLEEARLRSPSDPYVWLALAELHREREDPLASSAAALEAVRSAPGSAPVVGAAGRPLLQAVVPAHLAAAADEVESALPRAFRVGELSFWRGRWLLELGRPDEAAAALWEAQEHGRTPAEVAPHLRRALIAGERFADGVAVGIAGLPAVALDPDANLLAERWATVQRTARAAQDGDAEECLDFAAALESVGWLDEAEAVLTYVRSDAPDHAGAVEQAARLRRFRRVLDDLRQIAQRNRSAMRRGDPGPDVEELLGVLGAVSQHHLGVDASAGAVTRSYPLLGEFAVSAASRGTFADVFGRRGLVLLIAARGSEPAVMVLSRLVSVRADVQAEVLGRQLTYDECLVEVAGLPPELAGLQGGLAGLTLDRLVIVELDAFRIARRKLDPRFPFALRAAPAGAELDRRALDTPSRVATRLDDRLAAEGGRLEAHLDAVIWHELGHVLDAQLLLPLRSPFGALRFALRHRFRPRAIETSLESRAAVAALVHARVPRAAFAQILSSLPATEGATPHAAAYHQVIAAMVEAIEETPERFPDIDLERNVAQQLDRLTDDEVRELGLRLVGRF